MNAILIDELKTLGLQYNEQQMLKRGQPLACLESVAKRLRRRQMIATVAVFAFSMFPVLVTMLFAVQFRDREIQSAAGNALLPVFLMLGLWQMTNLIAVIRQVSRCEMLALLAKLENEQPMAAGENVAA